MAHINVKPPTIRTRLLLVVGIILLIGAVLLVGWGIGWTVRRLVGDRGAPAPTETVRPTVLATTTADLFVPVPTGTPAVPTPVEPTSTLRPTDVSSPTPEPALVPTVRTYVVQAGDGGLATIAGMLCPNLVEYGEREAFARHIQQANPIKIQDINTVPSGIELVIPACPQ